MRSRFTLSRSILLFLMFGILAVGLMFPSWVALAQNKFDVIVHYIEGTAVRGKLEYQVEVTFSVLDSAGKVVKGLTAADVRVTEDSKKVEITSLSTSSSKPMSVILVLDTSGSMLGTPIESARKAAARFVEGLGSDDQAAVMSFNQQIVRVSEFSKDRQAASVKVDGIKAIENTGTCLYDAAYQAVQLAATVPSGRRAIILLTDGVDEIQRGKACSTKTVDDVINLATSGATRIPVFILGLGDRIDDKVLKRVAEMTGGRYQYSPGPNDLINLFGQVSEQLKSENVLRYTSNNTPGAHNLIVEVTYQGAKNQDMRKFILPELPLNIAILHPTEGQEVKGKVKIIASVSGSGEPVEQVEFQINGVVVGTDQVSPYELEWDFSTAPGGQAVTVVARGKGGVELSRSSVTVKAALPEAAPVLPAATLVPAASVSETAAIPREPEKKNEPSPILLLGLVAGIALLVVLLLALMVVLGRRKAGKKAGSEERLPPPTYMHQGDSRQPAADRQIKQGYDESKTMDFLSVGMANPVLGTLTVIFSDDAMMIGHVLNIARSPTTLGRAADNDIMFPKDTPVSRHHAIIEQVENQVQITEVITHDTDGTVRHPTYGTYVNEKKIESEPVVLKTGDEIRIGSRTRLSFVRLLPDAPPAEQVMETMEGLTLDQTSPIRRAGETKIE